MITHVGKIGHLSKLRRDELGRRIQDGEPGIDIVQWLNEQPDVKDILNEHFGGRAISEQNLSDWKHGGYIEWQWRQETMGSTKRLVEQSDELNDLVRSHSLAERFAGLLTAEITRLAGLLLEKETDLEKRWQRACDINRQLSMLRRDEHRAICTTIKQRKWLAEVAQQEKEDIIAMSKPFNEPLLDTLVSATRDQALRDRVYGIRRCTEQQPERRSASQPEPPKPRRSKTPATQFVGPVSSPGVSQPPSDLRSPPVAPVSSPGAAPMSPTKSDQINPNQGKTEASFPPQQPVHLSFSEGGSSNPSIQLRGSHDHSVHRHHPPKQGSLTHSESDQIKPNQGNLKPEPSSKPIEPISPILPCPTNPDIHSSINPALA